MSIEQNPRGTWSKGPACLSLFFILTLTASVSFGQKEMPLTGSKAAVAKFIAARDKGENLEDTGTMFDEVVALDPNFAYAYLFAGQTNPEALKAGAKAVSLADKA